MPALFQMSACAAIAFPFGPFCDTACRKVNAWKLVSERFGQLTICERLGFWEGALDMAIRNKTWLSIIVASGLSIALSACASGDKPAVASRPAVKAPAGELMPKGTSASVWRLRAGLNVAALSCKGRGRTSVSGDYRKLLSRHRTLLAQAYQAEERRLGRDRFDKQQTQIYNRFANQRSPERFCATASEVAKQANRMDSASLAPSSRRMVAHLESRLR